MEAKVVGGNLSILYSLLGSQSDINTASKRRWLDLKKKVSLIEVKKSLKLRTLLDKSRTNNPLKKVKDAIDLGLTNYQN